MMKKLLMIFTCFAILANFSYSNEEAEKIGDEIGIWEIKSGNLIKINATEENMAVKYWNSIYNILPHKEISNYINSFRLYTDGENGDLGGMNRLDESNANWQFDLDIKDMNIFSSDKKKVVDSTHTLIHEFGHLITLNIEQIKPEQDDDQLEYGFYETAEGYCLNNSYLNLFVEEFWADNLLDEWYDIDEVEDYEERHNRLYDFYLNYPEDFVSDYAAESPEEDIAESWTFFVFSDKREGNSIREQKINFFYRFPELVEYRTYIRKRVKIIPKDYLETFEQNQKKF